MSKGKGMRRRRDAGKASSPRRKRSDEEERSRTIDLTRADEEEEEEEEEDEPQPLAWRLLGGKPSKRDARHERLWRKRKRTETKLVLFATGLLHQKRRRTRERTRKVWHETIRFSNGHD